MCSGFKPKARFYGLLGLKNRHFYAVPGTAGKSSSADKPRGSPKAPENSRILRAELHIQPLMILEQAAMMGPVLCTTHIPIRRLKPNTTTAQKIKFLLIRRLTPLAFRRSIKMILPRYE